METGGLSTFLNTGDFNPFSITWLLIARGGWAFFVVLAAVGAAVIFVRNRQETYRQSIKWVLLAIDIPKDNEQTPKAVEHIFNHLATIKKNGDLIDRWWKGYTQQPLSFEIVSLGGYVQFIVRVPSKFRDMVEAVFYAQYPNAEITEVEDYVDDIPRRFPDREWDIWGTELKLDNKEYFPIVTYPVFEHTLTQTFLDPLASLLEILSRLRRGEQFWLQFVIRPPEDETWRENGLRAIKKLIGAKSSSGGGGILTAGQDIASGTWQTLIASIIPPDQDSSSSKDSGPESLMQHLPPHERRIVEQIGIKLSKYAYETKIRLVYAAKKKVFQDDRPATVIGGMLQYNTLESNGFKTDKKTKTSAKYWRADARKTVKKNKLISAYRDRDMDVGPYPFVLNTEELASIFHFPVMTVKAPLVKKTDAKKSEPPVSLPTVEEDLTEEEQFEGTVLPATLEERAAAASEHSVPSEDTSAAPPDNLPIA
ncbi:MAG: hypothetical protein WCV86_03265 [Patescibacteria group bacterium]|jgi:hypothetical protein